MNQPPEEAHGNAGSAHGYSLLAGLGFALAVLVAALLAGFELTWRPGAVVTWLDVFLGVLVTGYCGWWLLLARPRRFTLMRGATAGILVACLSYPVVLLLARFARLTLAFAHPGNLGEQVMDALALSGFELMTTGFFAAALLAICGAALAKVCARLARSTAAPPAVERPGVVRGLVRALGGLALCLLLFLFGAFVWLWFMPLPALNRQAEPAAPQGITYATSMAHFAAIEAQEAQLPLHPRCHSTLLTHGAKAARAVVYFHGLTNCPAQADELAPKLFALGYNVYIPRLPKHGEADLLTLALADLTAEDLATSAEDAVLLARGLGDEVAIMGLSAGGTMAALLAQEDAEVDDAIIIAPFLGPGILPRWAMRPATNLLLLLPNRMVWWNPLEPHPSPDMDYAYPRFATHALAEVMRLGLFVDADAQAGPPKAAHIGMLLNEADLAVSNAMAQQVAAAWTEHGRTIAIQTLGVDRALPHDLIDPRQPDADTDFVYPLLLDMLSGATAQQAK